MHFTVFTPFYVFTHTVNSEYKNLGEYHFRGFFRKGLITGGNINLAFLDWLGLTINKTEQLEALIRPGVRFRG